MGDYIKAVVVDIQKEEYETISNCGIEWKKMSRTINDICRQYFMQQEQQLTTI